MNCQREDYHHLEVKKAMKRIAHLAYTWDSHIGVQEPVRKQNGIEANSKYSLTNLLDEVRETDFLEPYEVDILGHIIPCCRKDKNKMDYIEKISSQG